MANATGAKNCSDGSLRCSLLTTISSNVGPYPPISRHWSNVRVEDCDGESEIRFDVAVSVWCCFRRPSDQAAQDAERRADTKSEPRDVV